MTGKNNQVKRWDDLNAMRTKKSVAPEFQIPFCSLVLPFILVIFLLLAQNWLSTDFSEGSHDTSPRRRQQEWNKTARVLN